MFSNATPNTYDIIHDKGTFDVVYLNKDLDNRKYGEAIRSRMKDESGAVFILTSCNLTSIEIDNIFVGEGLFSKKEEIKGYKSFTYGGTTG